mgnify:CR=1 FL=1
MGSGAGLDRRPPCPYTPHRSAIFAWRCPVPEKEAISTPHAAPPAGPYSQAVRWGNLVFTASVGSRDPRTGQPAPEEIGRAHV